MHLCLFGLFKKADSSRQRQDDNCRSRLASMKAHAANKEQPAHVDVMDRVRSLLGAEGQFARRRNAKEFWFMPESETCSRLRRSLNTGALAHLETTFVNGADNK